MTEIVKIVNGLDPPLMKSPLVIRINEYDIRNFQVLYTNLRKTVNYGLGMELTRAPPTKQNCYPNTNL